MKKFFMSVAMLSMSALLLTACGQKGEEAVTEEVPAEEAVTVEPVVPEVEIVTEEATESSEEAATEATEVPAE